MAHSPSLSHAGDPKTIAWRLLQESHVRDGLPEIFMGMFFLLTSSLIYAVNVLPRDSIRFQLAVVASSFLLPALALSAKWVLRWLRRRFLVERWGYVDHPMINRGRIVLGIKFAALMAVVLFGVVPRLSHPDAWRLAGAGLLGGALLAWGGRQPRFVVQGIVMAATGVLLAFSGVALETGFAIAFGIQGLLTLASGCVVFRRFMQQPIAQGEMT